MTKRDSAASERPEKFQEPNGRLTRNGRRVPPHKGGENEGTIPPLTKDARPVEQDNRLKPIVWNEVDEEFLKECVEEDWGQSCGPHPSRPIDDYSWTFVPEFPLDRLVGSKDNTPDSWVRWLKEENKGDHRPRNYYKHMEKWWAVEARRGAHCSDPITAAIDEDGRAYVWGGYHRTGISHKLGLAVVPVILGQLRPDAPPPPPPPKVEVTEHPPGYWDYLKAPRPEHERG